LLEAGTSTVVYEAATALTALTSNPVAVVSSIQYTKNLLQALTDSSVLSERSCNEVASNLQ
jgi:hypothetical protein